jgi:tRNA(fMet)-specific endonuclease VapC
VYLLDTDHCYRLIEGDPDVMDHLQARRELLVETSVVARGELIFMAQRSEQQAHNLQRVRSFLQGIRIYPVDGEVADRYGALKADLVRHYGPRHKSKRRTITIGQLGFHDNDLWVAAIALRHGLTVVSADSDFGRIREARELSVECWWSPPA